MSGDAPTSADGPSARTRSRQRRLRFVFCLTSAASVLALGYIVLLLSPIHVWVVRTDPAIASVRLSGGGCARESVVLSGIGVVGCVARRDGTLVLEVTERAGGKCSAHVFYDHGGGTQEVLSVRGCSVAVDRWRFPSGSDSDGVPLESGRTETGR
jgi:hypothetical protein